MKAPKLLLSAITMALAFGVTHAATVQTDSFSVYKPTGRGIGQVDELETAKARHAGVTHNATSRNKIVNHGGPIMTGQTHVYYIWYGNWSAYTNAKTILAALPNGLSGSGVYNINTTYTNNSGGRVANNIVLSGQVTDNYSKGTALSDQNILDIVTAQITSNALPNDPNGSYLVLTSPDVNETSGFGTQYCGWHTNATIGGKDVKYGFIGNPITIAPAGCGVNNPSPNGDGGADAMASVIFHELSETVTDPDGNAWYDGTGQENGDKCAWNFGATFKAPNGASANQTFASRNWLLQQMWLNVGSGSCALKY